MTWALIPCISALCLRAFVRCAVDIRNVDVEAAPQAGVLVTGETPLGAVNADRWMRRP